MLNDVCRLCMKKDDLVWIFDRRLENSENLRNVIFTTTGVEIDDRDMISQKICKNCCTITAKMFEFRTTSLANDQLLKEQYLKKLSGSIKESVNIPNINVKIFKANTTSENVKKTQEPSYKVHPTVRHLFKGYPEIKLPTVCLKSHIAPLVTLQMNEVENYFKAKNLDFKECTRIALQSEKVVKKRTSGIKLKSSFKIARVVPVECADKTKVSPIKIIQEKVNENKGQAKKIADSPCQTANTPCETTKNVTHKMQAQKIAEDSPCQAANTLCENTKNVTHKMQAKKIAEDSPWQAANTTCENTKNVPQKMQAKKIAEDSPCQAANIPCENRKNVADKVQAKKISEDSPCQDANTPCESRKRTLDPNEMPEKDYTKKPLFIESLGLTPKISIFTPTSESPAYVSNKSVPLHICNICNSVQYSAKDLKKHQQKHLKCQFCKMRFRTLDNKRQHIESMCIIKQTMQNLPDVELQKIEYDIEVRRTYPEAFVRFPPLDEDFDDNPEIIEIFSDDDEPILVTDMVPENAPEHVSAQTGSNNPTKALEMESCPEKTVDQPAFIVHPTIKIKCNQVLDRLDTKASDMQILKDLINLIPPMLSTREKRVQTEMPTNGSISVNRHDSTIELKHLKAQLHMYKIPVVIKNGTLKVAYNYGSEPKRPKKMCLWTDLMPIDIKVNKTVMKISSKIVSIDMNAVIPATHGMAKQISSVQGGQHKSSPTILNSSLANGTLPTQKITSPKFIRINKSSLISSSNIIDTNPLLNKFLHNSTTPSTAVTSSVSATSTNAVVPLPFPTTSTASVASNPSTTTVNQTSPTSSGTLGLIRVRNAWELK